MDLKALWFSGSDARAVGLTDVEPVAEIVTSFVALIVDQPETVAVTVLVACP